MNDIHLFLDDDGGVSVKIQVGSNVKTIAIDCFDVNVVLRHMKIIKIPTEAHSIEWSSDAAYLALSYIKSTGLVHLYHQGEEYFCKKRLYKYYNNMLEICIMSRKNCGVINKKRIIDYPEITDQQILSCMIM